MNASATNVPAKVPVVAGGQVAALVPQSLEEAFRVSQAIAVSGLAPRGLDKPEQIMVAIMAGAELGLAPFQALQSFAVVNGRPTLWGDGLIAVARAQGVKVREWLEGEGDETIAHCEAVRPGGEAIERTFSVAQAKKASLWGKQGPWQSYPQRMLAMRARAYALRDGCADMLRGFQVREEVEDYEPIRDVTPKRTGMRERLEARTPTGGFDADHVSRELDEALAGDQLPAHDAQTGEIIDAVIDPPADDGLPVRDDTPVDTFPGDNPMPSSATMRGSDVKSLSDRATDFEAALVACADQPARDIAWRLATQLRTALDKGDPDRLSEIERLFNRLSGAGED